MRINIKNWKVLNNNLPLFLLFCFLGCLFLATRVNYWYFLLIVLLPFALCENKINIKQLIVLSCCFLVFSILLVLCPNFSVIGLIRNNMVGYTRKGIFNFLDSNYTKEVSSFIKLILFNEKTTESYIFYKQTVDLGIVWLFCISGFHISLLSRLINRCFKKQPIIGRYANILIIAFYSYLLNFSYASIRIVINLILKPYFKIFHTKDFDKIGFIGLIICFLNPCCFKEYSFLLSFIIWIGAHCVNKLKLNSRIISNLLVNILAIILIIPFIFKMNHRISIFSIFNAFIFSNISILIFIYFAIFCWMPFMQIIHHGLIIGIYAIIGNISFTNAFIYSNVWQPYKICIFYLLLFIALKIIYLIVKNNKI